ncbi:hypothetical protein [Rhodococcus sp. YH1]|uniref:hypothetical protein n=1 Tax=Rhodococcus sp. YH1 TaxID=89066 RepID=UPI0013872272
MSTWRRPCRCYGSQRIPRHTAFEHLIEVVASITAATGLLADPNVLDAYRRRVQADADRVGAAAGVEIARLDKQLVAFGDWPHWIGSTSSPLRRRSSDSGGIGSGAGTKRPRDRIRCDLVTTVLRRP